MAGFKELYADRQADDAATDDHRSPIPSKIWHWNPAAVKRNRMYQL